MTSSVQIRHEYKIYAKTGEYLGLLDNVVSPFAYDNEINGAGASMDMIVQLTGDTSRLAVEPIETENGLPLQTEAGDVLTTERQPDAIGNFNSKAKIRNNNIVKVMEYSSDNPNGEIVFQGYISSWEAVFGEDNRVYVSCLGFGTGLDNNIIEEVPTNDITQATQDSSVLLYDGSSLPIAYRKIGQTFTPTQTNLSSVILRLAAYDAAKPQVVTVKIWKNTTDYSTGSPLGVSTRTISSTTPAEYQFSFSSIVPLAIATNYFMSVETSGSYDTDGLYIYYRASDVYAGGSMFVSTGTGLGTPYWNQTPFGSYPASDLYFKTYCSSGATKTTFSNQDPSEIIRDILDAYIGLGGEVTYDSGSIDDTGTSVSYTFNVNTTLEGIQKALSLAPTGWYWYVDPATNILYFKEIATTATHRFIKGRHFSVLQLKSTIERLKNVVYFTGGDDGSGTNLFLKASSSASLEVNRVGVERITDNRVTVAQTAITIASGFLDENASEHYITKITILSTTYDITSINIGETVAFRNVGVSFVESLVLQIVAINRQADRITLVLGMLPRREVIQTEELRRALVQTQTVDNPVIPS